jgi:hypothetical protein
MHVGACIRAASETPLEGEKGSQRMERHRTRKGLHEMGGISQQALFPGRPIITRQGRAVAIAHPGGLNGLWSALVLRPFGLEGGHDRDRHARTTAPRPTSFGFSRLIKPRVISDIFTTLRQVHAQRTCSRAAFSLHRPGPSENAATTDGLPVRIGDVRVQQNKRRRCLQPRRCPDRDLRFSFPHMGRFLHFLFQVARIGLGRSVKED